MGICRLAAEQKGVPAAGTLLCAGEWPWRTNSIWVSPGRREDTWITVRCCRFAVKRWVCWLNVAYLSLFDTLFSVRTLLGIPRLQSTTGWCVVFGLVLTGPLQCLCCLEIKLLGVLLLVLVVGVACPPLIKMEFLVVEQRLCFAAHRIVTVCYQALQTSPVRCRGDIRKWCLYMGGTYFKRPCWCHLWTKMGCGWCVVATCLWRTVLKSYIHFA